MKMAVARATIESDHVSLRLNGFDQLSQEDMRHVYGGRIIPIGPTNVAVRIAELIARWFR